MKHNVVKNKVEDIGYGYRDDNSVVEISDKESGWIVTKIPKLKPLYYQTYFTESELKDIDETGFIR